MANSPAAGPGPKASNRALDEREIEEKLRSLPDWHVEQNADKIELARSYRFASFDAALEFINAAADEIRRADHHPRWENVYRDLNVRLTTHSLGNRISDLDFRIAQAMEDLYDCRYHT